MRNINELIVDQLSRDKALRLIHIKEAVSYLMQGDQRTGLLMLRNLVNATCGFPAIGAHVNKDPKSVMRMLSLKGNPQADTIFQIINYIITQEECSLEVKRARKIA